MSPRRIAHVITGIVPLADGVTRYDLVLALIPTAYLGGVLAAVVAGSEPSVGVTGGSVIALAATAYALFGLSPTVKTTRRRFTS